MFRELHLFPYSGEGIQASDLLPVGNRKVGVSISPQVQVQFPKRFVYQLFIIQDDGQSP
jgi:hypothetical protein